MAIPEILANFLSWFSHLSSLCSKAKNALNTVVSPDQYQVLEIENHQDMNDIQNYMAEKTGGRSVPRVFIDGKFVGGGDDMVRLAQNGKLAELVK